MKAQTRLVDFDINDEKTYPKREGSYLVADEYNRFFVAFWADIEEVRHADNFGIRRNPHWIIEGDHPWIHKYCDTPLCELDWSIGEK